MKDDSSAAGEAPLVAGRLTAPATGELPDDLRIPLHELQADAAYLIGRVATDGSTSSMILQVLETKLSHVAEAAYRLNGSRNDLLEALKALMECADGGLFVEADAFASNALRSARAALSKAEPRP